MARSTSGRAAFLGVGTYDQRQPAPAVADRYRVPIKYDPLGIAAARYGLPGMPVTFFLSASGRTMVGVNDGALTARSLYRILRML